MLCEAGLLPGVLMRNRDLSFHCEWTHLRVENPYTGFSSNCEKDQVIQVPISHGEGNYYADPNTLQALNDDGLIVFRYCSPSGGITEGSNPNGSLQNIAGIVNKNGNVLGMMPHPERCCELLLGGTDGRLIFESIAASAG